MKFTSTRDKSLRVGFTQAVMNCLPKDGGMYVPCEMEDLRKWILYTDEDSTFSSIAGSLTSAFMHEEYSPIICETIASMAFPFAPEIRQLDENLFTLDLTKGPTGIHRDFGISYLVSILETAFKLKGGRAVFLDVSTGELGASLAATMRGKTSLKAVVVYPKGCVRGLEESDFVWNGGNIYPVEIDGTEEDCNKFVRMIFDDAEFTERNHLTLANTVNIGRLLPQAFFYPYAFSKIKNKINGDIVYSLAAGNYSNLVAGLYAWQFALPVNGFVIPAKESLVVDPSGNPLILDSLVPLSERENADPSRAFNLERLEDIFSANQLMMRHFIYPVEISENETHEATKELFTAYNIYADFHSSKAYAASRLVNSENCTEAANVLILRDHPCYSADYMRQTIGELPPVSDSVLKAMKKTVTGRPCVSSVEEIRKIIESL